MRGFVWHVAVLYIYISIYVFEGLSEQSPDWEELPTLFGILSLGRNDRGLSSIARWSAQ